MLAVRRPVLDVLKPHDPPLVEFTDQIAGIDGVAGATCSLIELDREARNVEVALEGEAIDVDVVEATIGGLGGTVHSIDLVACGDRVASERSPRPDA